MITPLARVESEDRAYRGVGHSGDVGIAKIQSDSGGDGCQARAAPAANSGTAAPTNR